jgi:hypothetical protein
MRPSNISICNTRSLPLLFLRQVVEELARVCEKSLKSD